MWKNFAIVVLSSLLFVSCINRTPTETNETSIWQNIVNKEWSNVESFPGDGFYFFEQNGMAYCTYFVYGSGMPVIYHKTSEVVIEEGTILVSISKPDELKKDEVKIVEIKLIYESDFILYDNKHYSLDLKRKSQDYID